MSRINNLSNTTSITSVPDRVGAYRPAPVIERDREFEVLAHLGAQAKSGEGSIVLVTGEAGIGKTTLINEYRKKFAHTYKFFVGASDPLAAPTPFGPIFEMAPLFDPSVKSLLKTTDSRLEIIEAVFADIAEASPTPVLVFEDIHWADSETLDFLSYVGRRISILPCLIILTYRNDEVEANSALQVTLGELPHSRCAPFAISPAEPQRRVSAHSWCFD